MWVDAVKSDFFVIKKVGDSRLKNMPKSVFSVCALQRYYAQSGPPQLVVDQKSLKSPRETDIETICARNEGCKFTGMTCSTCRRNTKDKEKKYSKMAKKGPQKAKNQNFEKQKIVFFFSCPKEYYAKKLSS